MHREGGGRGYEFNKCAATLATWTLCAAGEVENCTRTSSECARRALCTIKSNDFTNKRSTPYFLLLSNQLRKVGAGIGRGKTHPENGECGRHLA